MTKLFLLLWALGSGTLPANAEEKEISIEEFLQGLSTVPGVVYRKDPFVEAAPPFEAPKPDVNLMNAPVLERYPTNTYAVVAVMTGEQYPRALIRLPESEGRKVVIVREKDKLGNRGGIISKINKDGLVVIENQRTPLGFVDKAQVTVPLAHEPPAKQ